MNNTLPFTSDKRRQLLVQQLKREAIGEKYKNKRQQINFSSLINEIEADLKSKKQAEMEDYARHYDWLITNVLEEEQKKKYKMDKYLKNQEEKMNKAYVELYQRYNSECTRMKKRIEELEKNYK